MLLIHTRSEFRSSLGRLLVPKMFRFQLSNAKLFSANSQPLVEFECKLFRNSQPIVEFKCKLLRREWLKCIWSAPSCQFSVQSEVPRHWSGESKRYFVGSLYLVCYDAASMFPVAAEGSQVPLSRLERKLVQHLRRNFARASVSAFQYFIRWHTFAMYRHEV